MEHKTPAAFGELTQNSTRPLRLKSNISAWTMFVNITAAQLSHVLSIN